MMSDLDSKVKELFGDKPIDEVKKAFSTALSIVMVLEFAVVLGVFVLLKAFASQFLADVWMVLVFAVVLKCNIDLVQPYVTKSALDMLGKKDEVETSGDKKDKDNEKQEDTTARSEEPTED